jgi:hypothetical protein
MKDTDYNLNTFAFQEHNALWEHIMYIVDLNIKMETEQAISSELSGESRVHQCGRASAMSDFKNLLLEERKNARIKAGLTPE